MVKCLIIGAGIGGLTAAICLAHTGHKVEIFEHATALENIGGGIQQSPNAMAIWHALGLAEDVEAKSCEPDAGILRDYKTGQPLLITQMKGVYDARYGHKYLHIHRADLITILAEKAARLGINIHFNHAFEEAQQIGDTVNIIAGQKNFTGDVLIGADGVKSVLRPMIAGESQPRFTGQVAWRGLVKANLLPPDYTPFAANNWLGPHRHFVSYYVSGGEYINFVAVEERESWAEEGWRHMADKDDILQTFDGWDARVTTLINACEDSYLWGLFDHAPLTQWSEGQMTLLGDAAHPMLPFMAQGASMAIEDGWVLAHALSQKTISLADALKRYEQARKPRATALQSISRDNAKLYHAPKGLDRAVRNLKLKIATLIPAAAFSRLDKIYGVDVTQEYPISQ